MGSNFEAQQWRLENHRRYFTAAHGGAFLLVQSQKNQLGPLKEEEAQKCAYWSNWKYSVDSYQQPLRSHWLRGKQKAFDFCNFPLILSSGFSFVFVFTNYFYLAQFIIWVSSKFSFWEKFQLSCQRLVSSFFLGWCFCFVLFVGFFRFLGSVSFWIPEGVWKIELPSKSLKR